MAEGGEKTEDPTPKRLRESRQKGQVAKSQDLSAAVLFLAIALLLLTTGGKIRETLSGALIDSIQLALSAPALNVESACEMLRDGMRVMFRVLAPFLLVGFVVAGATMYFQVGPLFSMQPLSPQLSKIDPLKGFKSRFFSMQTYIELGKSLVKITIVGVLVYFVLKGALRDIGLTVRHPIETGVILTEKLVHSLVLKVGALFLVVGAADVLLQRHQHLKKLKMSKEEVKREYKQQEGDPMHKHERKRMHQEILQHNMVQDVRKADVLITNPTHLAVAIQYQKGEMGAPQVTAKGERLVAQQMIEVARKYKVPIMRNVPLAHALFALEVGAEIPAELYAAMAEVLNWVYSQREEAAR